MFTIRVSNTQDQAYLNAKEGDWTKQGFILPSGVVFPNPLPGMVWMVVEGSLMLMKEPVEC